MQRNERDARVLIGIRILVFETRRDRAHLRLGPGERDPGFQTRPGIEITAVAHLARIIVRREGMNRDVPRRRDPKFAILVRRKTGRHDSDDGELFAVEKQVAAEDASIAAEAAHPKLMTEHDHM